MIISASRRTDIPCYYSEWFVNRLKAGHVLTRNPFNHAQLSRVSLSKNVVDCIVFWTKDAKNILPYLDEIDAMGYKYYFQFTLTPYGKDIEKNLRDKSEISKTFTQLSGRIGKQRVVWRYDPIILNDTLTIDWHKEQFLRYCENLSPYTDSVTISFVDNYKKLKNPLIREIVPEEMAELAEFIGSTAKKHGLKPQACCESVDLSVYGINRASCIDKSKIEMVCNSSMTLSNDSNQREGCGCCESIDIGVYNTCVNGCVYCYANNSSSTASRRQEAHDPLSELLLGKPLEGEKITDRKTASSIQNQVTLFR